MFEGETPVQSFEQKLDEKVAMGALVKKVVPRPADRNMELRLPTVEVLRPAVKAVMRAL